MYKFVLFPGCFSSTDFLSHLKYSSVVWLLLNQRANWPPVPVAIPPYFPKIEDSLPSHRCSSLRQSRSADANRRQPISYTSHLLCYPYPALTGGAAEPGNGGTLRPVFCRTVSACSLASGQKVWVLRGAWGLKHTSDK